MKSTRLGQRRSSIRSTFSVASIGALTAGLLVAAALAVTGVAAPTPVTTPPPVSYPTPRFGPTAGPYIGEAAALRIAGSIGTGPVVRQELRLMKYRDVSRFLGSVNRYYHPDRDVYFVVTSAPWQTRGGLLGDSVNCLSYVAVIDASDGAVLEAGCDEPNLTWPKVLPPVFN